MRLWPRRRPAPVQPQANPTRIATLERDLYGRAPGADGLTYLADAIRKAGNCFEHKPMDVSQPGEQAGTRGVCTGCGNDMRLGDDGEWRVQR